MNLRDFALEIEPSASPERINEIEQIFHKLAYKMFIELSEEVDDDAMHHRINYAHEVARILRDKAHEHLFESNMKARIP